MFFWRRNQRLPDQETAACLLVRQSDLFDAAWYLEKYPDVRAAGFDAATHYVRHGASEGRQPGPWFEPQRYIESVGDPSSIDNPLLHYLQNKDEVTLKDPQVNRPYSNFSEFLAYTALNPVIPAPFQEADKRCFAVMEGITDYLMNALQDDESIKVSIVMPVRDRANTLQAAIDSVLAQTYSNFELLIVDDGSTDDSVEIAKRAAASDKRVRAIALTAHQGVCAARNRALEQASGQVIAYLDSDNIWLERYLAASVGALSLLPDAGAVYSGQYLYSNADTTVLTAVRFGPANISLLEQHNYVDLNCLVHRSTVISSGITFDENLDRLVDWDFILRIFAEFRVCSIPVLQSCYYTHAAENTITKTVPFESAARIIGDKVKCNEKGGATLRLQRKVCVVIPSFQALSFLKNCIASLEAYFVSPFFELVIVDNQSSSDVRDYLASLRVDNIKIILNDVNYGFSYAVNQGASMASPDADIVLLNNDAHLAGGALELMQQVAYEATDIAMSVPRQIVAANTEDIREHVPYADPGAECDVNLSVHHRNIESIGLFHDGRRVNLNFAPFFCVYIKRDAWDACTGLDHVHGRHYRSDRIMCDLVRHVLRQRIVYAPEARVYHGSQIATKALDTIEGGSDSRESMLIKNMWPETLIKKLNITKARWDSNQI